jgi:hypothetical protein
MLTVFVVGLGVLGFAGTAAADNSLEVTSDAAIEGNYGLRVHIDQGTLTEAYVQSDHPQTESHFRVGVWVDARNLDQPISPRVNKCFVFMKLYSNNQTKQHTFVYICRNNEDTAYRVCVNTKRDNNTFNWVGGTFLQNDSTGPRFVEVEWQAADPGQNNGFVKLYRDGVMKKQATGLDNDSWNVDRVRMGVPPLPRMGDLVQGSFDLDSYVSTR